MNSYKCSIIWRSLLIPSLIFGCTLLFFILMWDSSNFDFSLLKQAFPETVKVAFGLKRQTYSFSLNNEFDKRNNDIKDCEITVYWRPSWAKISRLDEVHCLHNEPASPTLSRGKTSSRDFFFSTNNFYRRLWCWDEILEGGHHSNDFSCRSLWLFSLREDQEVQKDWENCLTVQKSKKNSRNVIHFANPTVPPRIQFWWVVEPSFSSTSHDSHGSNEKRSAFQKVHIPFSHSHSSYSPLLPGLLVRWMPNISTLCPPSLTFLYAFSDVHIERVIISASSTLSSDLFSASQVSGRQQKKGNREGRGETIDKYTIKIMCVDRRKDSRTPNDRTTEKPEPRHAPAAIEIFLTTFWWDPFSSVPTIKTLRAATPIVRFRAKNMQSIVVASSSRFFSSTLELPLLFSSFLSLTNGPRKYFHGFSLFDTPFGFVDNVLLLQQEHGNENVFVGLFSEILPTTADAEARPLFPLIDSGSVSLASATSSVVSTLSPYSTINGFSTVPFLSASFSSFFSPVTFPSRWWVHRLDTPWLVQPLAYPSTPPSPSFICYSPRFHLTGSIWHSNFIKHSSFFHLFLIHPVSGSTKLLMQISSSLLVSHLSHEASEVGENYVKKSTEVDRNIPAEDVHQRFHQCHFDEDLSVNFLLIRVRLVVYVSTCMHYCLSSSNDFLFRLPITDPSAPPPVLDWGHDVKVGCPCTEKRELWEASVALQSDGRTVRYIRPFQSVSVDHISKRRKRTSFSRNESLRNDKLFSSSFSPHEGDLRRTWDLGKESSRCAPLYAWEWWGLRTTTESLFFFFSKWSCRLVHYSLYEIMLLFFRFSPPIFVMLCVKELLIRISSRW